MPLVLALLLVRGLPAFLLSVLIFPATALAALPVAECREEQVPGLVVE